MPEESSVAYLVDKYFYTHQFPTMWCPGCGNGTVVMAMARAVERLGLDFDKVIHVAGIDVPVWPIGIRRSLLYKLRTVGLCLVRPA